MTTDRGFFCSRTFRRRRHGFVASKNTSCLEKMATLKNDWEAKSDAYKWQTGEALAGLRDNQKISDEDKESLREKYFSGSREPVVLWEQAWRKFPDEESRGGGTMEDCLFRMALSHEL